MYIHGLIYLSSSYKIKLTITSSDKMCILILTVWQTPTHCIILKRLSFLLNTHINRIHRTMRWRVKQLQIDIAIYCYIKYYQVLQRSGWRNAFWGVWVGRCRANVLKINWKCWTSTRRLQWSAIDDEFSSTLYHNYNNDHSAIKENSPYLAISSLQCDQCRYIFFNTIFWQITCELFHAVMFF